MCSEQDTEFALYHKARRAAVAGVSPFGIPDFKNSRSRPFGSSHLVAMTYYLAVVGTLDNPMYETTLFSSRAPPSSSNSATAAAVSPSQSSFSIFGSPSLPPPALGKSNVGYGSKTGRHVMQLVAHAALDVVEDVQWVHNSMSVCPLQ